ncbi:MAG: hypothetical protein AUJ28_02985 [Parcubacteria group bacterium CG1_02_37_51]|uniref:Uncharacterized protein n=2 Tax=Candidatus Komeiliibacteriota TaxID=1817908 RepID=A0A2M8DPV8_9BACT|nr:MAG: hypothetical protein AUJ28_02985 [Parcubacteria group bacterium CG1_02_37_51]PIY95256.1 MAG: hypothetical protein COY67_00815 [Candidatus Komeilibacteria bacterium CG_4_10_14_0_8_um_filter_37_78]PJC00939.1 MAG: hypothetical protein CO073_04940 [Candidatus Komeilibacteria bacterium CG_4_9_14_0_8_um_filter_36_9]
MKQKIGKLTGRFKVRYNNRDFYCDLQATHDIGYLTYRQQHALVAAIAINFLDSVELEMLVKRFFYCGGAVQYYWAIDKNHRALKKIIVEFIRIFPAVSHQKCLLDISFKTEYRIEFDQQYVKN